MKSARMVLIAAAAVLAACDGSSRQAMGTVSSVIVIATDSLWSAVGDSVMSALEPRIFTVRDERTFDVTHVAPGAANWNELRRFRQVVAMGAADDEWVQPVLAKEGRTGTGAGLVQTEDVWARNQFATALVLPSTNAADAAMQQLPRLAAAIDSAFRDYAVRRMYTSAPDTLLRDSLLQAAGYGILLPNVYSRVERTDVAMFQNATQIGGDLVRSVMIATREGVLEPDVETALAWRDSVARAEYRPAQETGRDRVTGSSITVDGNPAVEVRGVWTGTDPSWPTSGPFITRMIPCPAQDRTFLVDAWLFAPSRSKYEYMIQLETILNTFTCGER